MDEIETKSTPTEGVRCEYCDDMIFAGTTPMGADYLTCPVCDNMIECSYLWNSESPYDVPDIDAEYCNKCKTVFKFCKSHAINGCTDDIYFSDLVEYYKYKDNNWIKGTPIFKSINDFKERYKDLKIKWLCKHENFCPKAFYPYDKYPQDYE